MDVLDNIETITYKHDDTIKYAFSMKNRYGEIRTYEAGENFSMYNDLFYSKMVVTYKNGLCHSINGKPSIVTYDEDGTIKHLMWHNDGVVYRLFCVSSVHYNTNENGENILNSKIKSMLGIE